MRLPRLTVRQILAWADDFHARTAKWPTSQMRPAVILGTNGEKWGNVDHLLRVGGRGLPGGSSLPRLLARHRGVRNLAGQPHLTVNQILAWADEFRERTGSWPTSRHFAEVIAGSGGQRWWAVDRALREGMRGLPGGSSLARLLARDRGVPISKEPMKKRMARGRR